MVTYILEPFKYLNLNLIPLTQTLSLYTSPYRADILGYVSIQNSTLQKPTKGIYSVSTFLCR